MKKFKYLLLFVIFFIVCPSVEAKTDYNYWNVCDNKEITKTGGCGVNEINSIPKPEKIEVEDDNPGKTVKKVFPNYNFLLLIDTSNSMEKAGFLSGGDRKSYIVTAIKKFIEDIENYDKKDSIPGKENETSSTISYILTNQIDSVGKVYDKRSKINRKSDFDYKTGGNTLLQNLWKKAYDYFNKDNSCNVRNVPVVILFTDGYPNTYSSVTDVTSDFYPSKQMSSIYTEFSSLYAYSTVSTMLSFIQHACSNLKIYNFGVGMHSDDAFANYLLNPTSTNSGSLTSYSSSNPATASSHLSTLLKGGKVYESTAAIGGGNPEYGFFSSSLGETTVNGNKKTTLTYSTSFNSQSLNRWNDSIGGLLYLSILLPKGRRTIGWGDIARVEYNNGGGFVRIDEDKIRHTASGTIFTPYDVQGELEHFTIGIKKSGVTNPDSITQVRIVFDFYDSRFDKFGYIQVAGLGNVDGQIKGKVFSYVGVDTTAISNMLKNSYGESIDIDVPVSGQKRLVTKVTHNSCDDFTVANSSIFNDVYVKVSKNDLDPLDPNLPNESCVKIDKKGINSIEGVVTESLKLSPGGPTEKSIAAGLGFGFNTPSLTSTVKWYFSKLLYVESRNKYYPVVKIDGQDKKNLRADGSTYFTHINGSYTLDELYRDGQCKNSYSNILNSLEEQAWNTIDKRINKNFTFTGKVKSNDWNKYDPKSEVDAPLDTEKYTPNNGVRDSNLYSNLVDYSISYTSKLRTAFINSQTHLVDYQSNENYYNNSDIWIKQTKKLYFVSFDYPDNKAFDIKYKKENYSLIGIKNNFENKCSILVKNTIDGDPDPKKTVLKYHYRPIDVSDPFPKTGNNASLIVSVYKAQNWVEWYQKESNRARLSNTYYGNSLYSISSRDGRNLSGGDSYFSWSGMNIDGTSNFVIQNFKDRVGNSSYCGLGIFKDECDR